MFRRWSLMAAALLLLGPSRAAQAPDVSERAIVRAAEEYVKAYQDQLTSVLADETYRQEIVRQIPYAREMPRTRTLRSELFFMFAPAAGWMAIRDVISVDGRPAADRPDIHAALRTLPLREVATTFKGYNSRFNVGRTYRNFNEPTLSLLVLDPEHRSRFSFDIRRVERVADAAFVTLAFAEKERPTLIRDLEAGHVFSRGELTVEAGSGRVRHAVLRATIRSLRLELATQYVPIERLGIWAPASFREEYEYGAMRAGEFESIVCEATYTNYRRFETSARIK